MNFNTSQESAILHKDGPMLVLAGPGSGKTAVITHRTYNLIKEYQIDPASILVITFTKAAALEMKERFFALAKEDKSYMHVTFGTFHAIFFSILKRAYHFDSTNILPEASKYDLMKQLIAKYQLEYRDESEYIGSLLAEISNIKNNRLDLEHYYSKNCGEEVFRKIYKDYQGYLEHNRFIDFDDMLLYTYELFAERKDILASWQKKFRYIMIDEYQDINLLQFEVIKMLAGERANLFVVGDDDQSIYGFRGSKPEMMFRFQEIYSNVQTVTLDVNYRSDANILMDALKCIRHNPKRFEKSQVAVKEAKYKVQYQSFLKEREQYKYIVSKIENHKALGRPLSLFAVLYRTNAEPSLLAEMLTDKNISFTIRDGITNLYEHWIFKDLWTYLKLASGSRKRSDILHIMNRPLRYISRDSLYAEEIDFVEWEKLFDEQPWIGERIEKLSRDILFLSTLRPNAAINYIMHEIGYEEYLTEYCNTHNADLAELQDIVNWIKESARPYRNQKDWEEHIRSYTENLRKQKDKRALDGVILTTLHGSKGMEFEHVIIMNVNEGKIPYKKALLEEDLEEERRLFYVGMTRAKKHLEICYVEDESNPELLRSRFIDEIVYSSDSSK